MKSAIMFVFVVGAWAFALLSSCKETLPPEPPYVIFPPDDAGPIASKDAELEVPADCRLACENLAKLGCPESHPAGRSCGSVCAAAEREGIDIPTICIANASTPDQARACGQIRCKGR